MSDCSSRLILRYSLMVSPVRLVSAHLFNNSCQPMRLFFHFFE